MNTLKNSQQEKAAILVAAGQLTEQQIADSLGISRTSLVRWKRNPRFAARVDALNKLMCAEALKHGIAQRESRIATQQELHGKLLTVIEERSKDPELQAVPGGKTGLICKTLKGVGKGKDFRLVEVYEVDTASAKTLLAIHELVAKEMGQHVEAQEQVKIGLAERVAEARKRVADGLKQPAKVEMPKLPKETVN